jgi:hypothetical protein
MYMYARMNLSTAANMSRMCSLPLINGGAFGEIFTGWAADEK